MDDLDFSPLDLSPSVSTFPSQFVDAVADLRPSLLEMRPCSESAFGDCRSGRVGFVHTRNSTLIARRQGKRVAEHGHRADRRYAFMSLPIQRLPVIQNWDCHSCGDCCRLVVVITDEEKRRIEALDPANDPEVGPKPWFAPAEAGSNKWTLKQRPGGGCVFLTTGNRCRLQERFGADAKPLACRMFPSEFAAVLRANQLQLAALGRP